MHLRYIPYIFATFLCVIVGKVTFDLYIKIQLSEQVEKLEDQLAKRAHALSTLIQRKIGLKAAWHEMALHKSGILPKEALLSDPNLLAISSKLIQEHKELYQIRILNDLGFEVLRLNESGQAVETQNKSGRYYIDLAGFATMHSMVLSPIDLNFENGKPEQPLRPTIRLISRINHSMITIFNIDLTGFFSAPDLGELVDFYAYDSAGYYLIHPNKQLNWQASLNPQSTKSALTDFGINPTIKQPVTSIKDSDAYTISPLFVDESAYINASFIRKVFFLLKTNENFYTKTSTDALTVSLAVSTALALLIYSVIFIISILNRHKRELANQLEKEQTLLKQSFENLIKETKENEALNEELVETRKLNALGKMVAGVAHEMNTPIGSSLLINDQIIDETQELKKLYERQELTEEIFIEYIEELLETLSLNKTNLARAAELVNSFKRLASQEINNELEELELSTFCQDIKRATRLTFKSNNQIEFITEEPTDQSLTITTYPNLLLQCCLSIIENSVTHAFAEVAPNSEQQDKWVRISTSKSKGGALIRIADNGIGMHEEVLHNIFEPFYTTRTTQSNTGLGLHLCYLWITNRLKGKLTCSSEANRGTCFNIWLPSNLGPEPSPDTGSDSNPSSKSSNN